MENACQYSKSTHSLFRFGLVKLSLATSPLTLPTHFSIMIKTVFHMMLMWFFSEYFLADIPCGLSIINKNQLYVIFYACYFQDFSV